MRYLCMILVLAVGTAIVSKPTLGQSSTFTYQGQLRQSGEPFTGMADLEFRLYDQLTSGTQIGSTQSVPDWPVEDGLFQVELDFGASAFDGSDRFLEVTVDGAPLIPRQKVTATPYALLATGLASGSVGGGSVDPSEVQLRVVGTCPAGEYIQEVNQDGSVVCGIDAIGSDWRLGGNAGTNPGLDFIGTTDNQPLEFKVNGNRALRLEPDATSPNLIGGYSGNVVESGVEGGTIGGGGSSGLSNRVTDHYGTIGGGNNNRSGDGSGALNSAEHATVGGGSGNIAIGSRSTIAGGFGNSASDTGATIGGGSSNVASGPNAAISGGLSNLTTSPNATVSGGQGNIASGDGAAVGGGNSNVAESFVSVVAGGASNSAAGPGASVGGGEGNTSEGLLSAVAGGGSNFTSGDLSSISGGSLNTAIGVASTVSGGQANCAGGFFSWVGGVDANVRPPSGSPRPGNGCDSVPSSTEGTGDRGTFVWADSTGGPFTSTGRDQFLVRAAGGVGLGTNSPDAQLHVTESVNANAGNSSAHVAIIENTSASTGGGPDVLALKTSMAVPDSAANFITFFDGSDNPIGRIEGDGAGGIVFASGGADFAEWLPKRNPDETIEPGDVVGWHADGISLDTRGAIRVMAVSTRPIIAGNAPAEDDQDHWARVGFIGQVPVRVRGPVGAGDWVVASSLNDGTAIARSPDTLDSEQFRRVVGQALESNASNGAHKINVAIGLGNQEAYGEALARLQARNERLRDRFDEAEAHFETRLDGVEQQQQRELTALRQELALLRELVAPRVAQEVDR